MQKLLHISSTKQTQQAVITYFYVCMLSWIQRKTASSGYSLDGGCHPVGVFHIVTVHRSSPHFHTSIYIKHFKLQMWYVSPEYWRSSQKIAKTTHAGGAILVCLAVMSNADEDREFRALSQFRQDKYLWNIIIVLKSTDGRLGAGSQSPQQCYSGKLRWIWGSEMIDNDSSEIRLKSREDYISKWKYTNAPRPQRGKSEGTCRHR